MERCPSCGTKYNPSITASCTSCGRMLADLGQPAGDPGPGEPTPPPPGATRRRNFPVRLVVIGVIALGGFIYNFIAQAQRDDSGAVTRSGQVSVDEIRVGDCLDWPEEEEVSVYTARPCDQPHDLEVYHVFAYAAGGDVYPGEDALLEWGDERCYTAFTGYVGVVWEESPDLDYVISYPTRGSWDGGDRELFCALTPYQEGGRLVGSHKAGEA